MVALRGQVLGPHPINGELGLWYQRTGDPIDSWIGYTKAQLQAIPQGSGNLATRKATYATNAKNQLQTLLGPGYIVTVYLPTDGSFDIGNISIE